MMNAAQDTVKMEEVTAGLKIRLLSLTETINYRYYQ